MSSSWRSCTVAVASETDGSKTPRGIVPCKPFIQHLALLHATAGYALAHLFQRHSYAPPTPPATRLQCERPRVHRVHRRARARTRNGARDAAPVTREIRYHCGASIEALLNG